ncbi:targeting protein for Xklp2 isoform X3 [Labrus bergylta]|uniref:targeting protein for Xklp2 isoform X3 n=1 Tax=Labrus bergylta TaxID=56723 RepID=UPI00331385E2
MADSDSGETSDRYEFDAPSSVVDLKELDKADNNDMWFGPSTSTYRPPNVVTSWGGVTPAQSGARPKTRTSNPPPAQQLRVSKRKSTATAAPPLKKQKKSPVARPVRRSSAARRRTVQANTGTSTISRAAAPTPANTVPSSSEEQELERIRKLQQEVVLHRKKNEASYKAALAGNPPPKKMVLSATVPKEFHFNSNTRSKTAAASNAAHREVDYAAQLRKPSSPARPPRGATVPKPFNLSTGNKRRMGEPSAYVPMAQQIAQFQKRTPERYHLRSRSSQARGPSPVKGEHLRLTHPHTPHLMTNQRSRPPTVKSSEELEAEEVEKLNKFQFKALELNRKILEGVEGLKKPSVKEPTVPEGFELQIEKRLQERQAAKPQEDEEKHTFKSQPLPKKILEGVTGVPDKKVLPPTVPESPAFALKKRIHVVPKVEVKPPSPIKAPPVPHFGLPFQPQLPESHNVEVCPFSFEERERERRALKEKKLVEMRNEEVPQFKAQPLPDFDAVILPEKKKLEPTKPEPFKMRLDERGAVKSSRWEQMVKEEQKQREEAAVFKARPNTVTHKEPFQPKKDSRTVSGIYSSSVTEAFELSTERRARERQEFERQASEKEALRALMEEEQRREEEQRKKEDVSRMRQEQVHKAQPIRHYKPVDLKKSEVPLTVPHSPNFTDRFRL